MNSKRRYQIYLTVCKSIKIFKIKIVNNHRLNVFQKNVIPAYHPLSNKCQKLNDHADFTLNGRVRKTNEPKETQTTKTQVFT